MISALRLSPALPPGQFLAGVPAGRPAQARGLGPDGVIEYLTA
jgi:hypothetical protein